MSETIKEIPLDELHPFPDHPFGVRDDDAMQQTVESIKEYGVLVPAIARPREDARNKNVLVIGGSGSGKTRFFLKPNLMQLHSSYVVTDPNGYNIPR